ncbi:MAG TPA: PKD domain-containing protein [Frankiaceae bacterium]|nr:PKD domain-containing protein [Frankiaceae bacterium]
MRRIERVHTRRRVATQATLSAFLVASVAFGATQVISTTPAGSDSLIVEPTKSPKPVAVKTPKADPTTTPKPKPTAKKTEKPKPTYAPDEPKPTYDEPDKPEPTYTKDPDEPKPTESKPTVTGDPLQVEFWPYTDAVAGQSMDWKVKAYDGAGRLLRIEVQFGDGQSKVYEPSEACGYGTSVKQFFSHTYAKAGTYTGKATVTTGGCGAETETKSVSTSVKVIAEGTGNGPAQPTVSAKQTATGISLSGADADGFVKKFYIDWGDGSPESYVGPRSLDSCVDGQGSQWNTGAGRSYAEPGTYTVTVTVMSVNCDAGQGQTKSITLTITV